MTISKRKLKARMKANIKAIVRKLLNCINEHNFNQYGHENLVIKSYMNNFFNLKHIKNALNVKRLRELYDKCKSELNSLSVMQ